MGYLKYLTIFSEDVNNNNNNNNNIAVPEHVQHMTEVLLDHDIQVPESLRSLFKKEQRITNAEECIVLPPQSAFFSLPHEALKPMSREIKAIEEKFEQVARLACIAREYDAANVSQETWEHFLRSYIFRVFEESNEQSSRQSRCFGSRERPILGSCIKAEPNPRKHYTANFYLRIPVPIPDDIEKTPTGFNRNECVINFSLNTLVDLGSIAACPTVDLPTFRARLTEGQKPEQNGLICFPWALVEVQSTTEAAESCYSRAATGAHTALSMMKPLQPSWAAANGTPPVVSFTFSGPEVRVWLSFSEVKLLKPITEHMYIMGGHPEGNMVHSDPARHYPKHDILDREVLKPQIASRISHLRFIVSQHGPLRHITTESSQKSASQKLQASKDTNASETEKPISTSQGGLLSSERNFKLFDAAVMLSSHISEIPVLHPTAKSELRVSLSSEQKPSTSKSSNAPVTTKKGATYVRYNGIQIIIRLPSNDERKPGSVIEPNWDAKDYL